MTISEELAAFRAGCPDCTTVIFADMATGLVLASDAAERTTQEKLDALCMAARGDWSKPLTALLATALGGQAQPAPRVLWQADPSGILCFVAAPEIANEALCLLLTRDTSLQKVGEQATGLLMRIVAEG